MDQLDQGDEEIIIATVSDETLEAAAETDLSPTTPITYAYNAQNWCC